MYETESNNDFGLADTIMETPMTLQGARLDSTADQDFFKITLNGGGGNIDNLTVDFTSVDYGDNWGTGYYGTLYIAIYGAFEKEHLLMDVVSCRVRDWNICPLAFAHAFAPGFYYIRVMVSNPYYYYDEPINYELRITKEQTTSKDNNDIADNAIKINSGLDEQIDMAVDMFDWYYIESPDPHNYETNFSVTVDITASLPVNTISSIDFVTQVYLLIYHSTPLGTYKGETIIGNMYHRFNQPDPIFYYEWTEETTTYIGLYVQTLGRNDDGTGEYIAGDGYCDGWAKYSIKKLQAKPMIPPIVYNSTVKSPIGKIYHSYTYKVSYSDENNDRPQLITITMDQGVDMIGPFNMVKVNASDKNYRDGVTYYFRLDGSEFKSDLEEHNYRIIAYDKERDAEGLSGKTQPGPIITDNILPTARPSSSNLYSIFEDDPVSYLNLNDTFEDADNDTLYFRLSHDNQNWSNIYSSENITVKVWSDPMVEEGQKYLEFQPKKNRFNRNPGEKFGSEIIYINVSDADPYQEGGISRAHYLSEPFELELLITGVNDPPEIKKPFSNYLDYGEMVITEDQRYSNFDLTDVFWDPVENDPLTFSVREPKNVDVIFYTNATADFIPKENWTGTESLDIVADDGQAIVYNTLKIRVKPVNDNPVLNYTPKQILDEDEWFNYTFLGSDEADSEPIFFETNLMERLELSEDDYFFDPLTGELSFRPRNANVGTYKDIEVRVRDYNGGIASQYVVFEIRNTPDPPEPNILTPSHGHRFLDTERIDFQSEYFDPDDVIQIESHTFQWHSNLDGNLSVNPNFKAQLIAGEHKITLHVSDPIFSRAQTITIMVLSVSNLDTDKDGIPDYWELLHSLNHFDPQDAENDPDKDTFTNIEEYLGEDGQRGGNDDTDPRNPGEHPEKHYEPPKKDEATYSWELLIASVVIVIIIIFVFLLVLRKRRSDLKAEAEDEEAEASRSEEVHYQDMYGRKYKVFKYEPTEIVCHNCLNRLEIKIPIRPLVVTCNKCKSRGVLYK
jgi:hypothetical protein